jgi:D-aminopeptidase
MMRLLALVLLAAAAAPAAAPLPRPRARDLGVPFDGTPGPRNAISDVPGVAVGEATIVRGEGALVVGKGPVRTGVTVVLPRGKNVASPVFAGSSVINGNGEVTGLAWVRDSGFLESAIALTNTHAIGAVHEGMIRWRLAHGGPDADGYAWSTPVVGETWDGFLNDVNGFHVRPEQVAEALDAAAGGPVAEGSVGGGTGMVCFEFKGGSAPRRGSSRPNRADTPSGCWCNATADCGRSSRSPESPSGASSPSARCTRGRRARS